MSVVEPGSAGETKQADAAPAYDEKPTPPVHSDRRLLAVAGVVTGLAGIALSEVAASMLGAAAGPVGAVAAAVRDLTPGHLAVKLIHLVGHADKPLLVVGTSVILLGLMAYAATWARRQPLVPDLAFFALAVLGMLAVLRGPEPGIGGVISVGVGLITWMIAFRVLTKPVLYPDYGVGESASRRAFLVRSVAVVGTVAVLTYAGRLASSGRRQVEQARRLLRLPVTAGVAPAGSTIGLAGIAPWRTPNSDFYIIHTVISPPSIDPASWSLRIHGMVEREVTISYAELIKRPIVEDWITLCCVSNVVGGDLIGNAFWSGVLIKDLLAEAGPKPGADAVKQTSKDGWDCGTPLAALTDPGRKAMLAIAMNGQPLPVEHGFPVRMVVPGLYGFVSATKWVVDLEVTTLDSINAFWTQRGWSPRGPVKTQSRIDVPANGASVKAGTVKVGGSAWAQHTGIEKVEFQLDGGAWQTAELGRVPGADTWVQWAGAVDVSPGDHRLHVRATDASGYTQTSVKQDVLPDGATGWDSQQFSAT